MKKKELSLIDFIKKLMNSEEWKFPHPAVYIKEEGKKEERIEREILMKILEDDYFYVPTGYYKLNVTSISKKLHRYEYLGDYLVYTVSVENMIETLRKDAEQDRLTLEDLNYKEDYTTIDGGTVYKKEESYNLFYIVVDKEEKTVMKYEFDFAYIPRPLTEQELIASMNLFYKED